MKMKSLVKSLLVALLGIGLLTVTVPVMASDEPAEETVVEAQGDVAATGEEATADEGQEQQEEAPAEEAPAEKE